MPVADGGPNEALIQQRARRENLIFQAGFQAGLAEASRVIREFPSADREPTICAIQVLSTKISTGEIELRFQELTEEEHKELTGEKP